MLSKKLTFSLTFLVMLLAFGLAVYTPSVMGDGATHDFKVTISAAESMIDVSFEDGMQIATGRTRGSRTITEVSDITLLITTQEIVHLTKPGTGLEDRAGKLDAADLAIDAYDAEGRALGTLKFAASETANEIVRISHRDPTNPGKEFLVRIDETKLVNAYTADLGVRSGQTVAGLEIHTLLFSLGKGVLNQADIAHTIKVREGHDEHTNDRSNVYRIDLVDNDEGDAKYNTTISSLATGAAAGVPGVVAIQPLRERRGFIETGVFDVRVILTEEPKDGLTTDLVAVKNGTATKVTKGTTLKGAITATNLTRASELTSAIVDFYKTDNMLVTTTLTDLPSPTGRDNKFHQYFVTIQPDAGLTNADVVISIKQFVDKVKPEPKMYTPLSDQLVVATTLEGDPKNARDARVANEMLTVLATTGKDSATTAYEKRQKVLDGVANEWVLPNKTHIPAGGYLVAHVGDLGNTGIVDPKSKLKEKTAAGPAAELYNTTKLSLPFPADDLDTFFRNGGTLTLSYLDIPEATDSGHGDSTEVKPVDDDGDTGYRGANSTAYAEGALIFNEIMWGLDAGKKDSQYIELHNPGTTAIGIDNKEWVITVGAAPAGFTVIDTVSNVKDPVTEKYWSAPGDSGVTVATAEYPAVSDLVSMSRIPEAADGTAAASWAMSERPSANLGGRRIGTPGAANSYVEPTAPTPEPEPTPPAPAPVASPGDIMITEIMVASNSGHLPQWVELTNMSAGEVRLTGWSLVVQNDPADTEVVGSAVTLDLGDVVVGVDKEGRKQSVLVVSKAGRSSGVGTGADAKGMLREERIINVQSQVSPSTARYSLISEMGFTLTLVAPPSVGVRTDADVVGNLLKGWELPMSEGNRSSIIRREMGGATEIMGTDAAGWVLADATSLIGAYVGTYYGDKDDVGTPGYDAAGALPVELSKFGAKRDPLTGQVVVTWETQSELNNAGFYIKRAEHKTAQFVPVNPTLIPGAGTTSEKQSYTYTDTTAKPNIVYYYQIEDVSLDGNRQTLTRAHRLKGHIGAAGKLTTMWGELKEHE